MRIIRAIVADERNPQHLAALRNYRCKKEADQIAMALTGTWRAEHLFVLSQALALFDFSTTQLSACDAQIERVFSVIKPRFETTGEMAEPAPTATPSRRKPHSHSQNHALARLTERPAARAVSEHARVRFSALTPTLGFSRLTA